MGKTAQEPSVNVPLDAALDELRNAEHLTPARVVELFRTLPPSDAKQSSAELIRELRGPLPGDE